MLRRGKESGTTESAMDSLSRVVKYYLFWCEGKR